MLRSAARDILPGMTVNLGIGPPAAVLHYVPAGMPVCLHSENGIACVGGAIELAQKARRVGVAMTHTNRKDNPRILTECSLPLTARGRMNRIYTDMAVLDIAGGGLMLVEMAEGTDLAMLRAATAAPFAVPGRDLPRF